MKTLIGQQTFRCLGLVFVTMLGVIGINNAMASDITITSNTSWAPGVYQYDHVHVTNNAVLTFSAKPGAGEYVTLEATSITIDAGARISADGKGFAPAQGPGAGPSEYYGGGGAGHAGPGISGDRIGGGAAYGSVFSGTEFGSGGGNGRYTPGGAGGGVMSFVVSGDLIVNGNIDARGANGGYWSGNVFCGGGGSGGSIRIDAGTFSGTGRVRVDGGQGGCTTSKGDGSAGRIVLLYGQNSFTGELQAFGGQINGAHGTVFTKAHSENLGHVTVAGPTTQFITLQPTIIQNETGAISTLRITNKAMVTLAADGQLDVGTLETASGGRFYFNSGMLKIATLAVGGEVYWRQPLTAQAVVFTSPDGQLHLDQPLYGVDFNIAGKLFLNYPDANFSVTMMDGGQFYINQPFVIPHLEVTQGSAVFVNQRLNVDSLVVSDGGVLSHSPASPKAHVVVGGDLTVASGGMIDLNAKGYASDQGPGAGKTTTSGFNGGGGGHGGSGGASGSGSSPGKPYGSLNYPVTMGSGGSRYHFAGYNFPGGAGGGYLQLDVAGTLSVDGIIRANGGHGANLGSSNGAGGGAGGGLLLSATVLSGSGKISADGGWSTNYSAGGGGGGRIALYYGVKTFSGTVSALRGHGHYSGQGGTIYEANVGSYFGGMIQAQANITFTINAGVQSNGEFSLSNIDSVSHGVALELLNTDSTVTLTLTDGPTATLAPNSVTPIPVTFDATQAAPGRYETQLKLTNEDGAVFYSTLVINVVDPNAGKRPDLQITSQDLDFDVLNPNAGDPVTIFAHLRNRGTAAAENITVAVYNGDLRIAETLVDTLAIDGLAAVSFPLNFASNGVYLIRVVIDSDNVIDELAEDNNQSSNLLQVGDLSDAIGSIYVIGTLPTTVLQEQLFRISGSAVYEIEVSGNINRDFVVKGGAVRITLTNPATGQQWVYGDVHTDDSGRFSKVVQAPENLGTYTVSLAVTDFTFTGGRDINFSVVPPAPPPPPPTSSGSGSGSWVAKPTGGSGVPSWTWSWTVPPPPEQTPQDDLYIYSSDIAFSNDNPALGERIDIVSTLHFWAPDTDMVAQDVPVSVHVTYPGFPAEKIGEVVLDQITVGAPNFGSQQIFTSWRNTAEGIYIVETAAGVRNSEKNSRNNAATRAIIVGDLPTGAIAGHVYDEAGALANVRVELLNLQGVIQSSALTDSAGGYLFADLNVAEMAVRIIVPEGYTSATIVPKAATVTANTVTTVDFTLSSQSPPIAADSQWSTDEDTAVVVTLTATDADGDTLNFTIVDAPAHGNVVGAGASWTYSPATNFTGTDQFTFFVHDGQNQSSLATVTITVNPVNDPPIAASETYTVDEDSVLSLVAPGVLGNDSDVEGDALSASVATGTAHGTLALAADGALIYTPDANFFGTDSFTYQAFDGTVSSTPVAVSIDVLPVNDVPVVIIGQDVVIDEGSGFTQLGSFNDPDQDAWTATIDYGSGVQALALSGFNFETSASFDDDASVLVTATVDDGLAAGSDQLIITVNNVAPSVALTADVLEIIEGQSVAFTGTFTDPGADTHTSMLAFGDGQQATTQSASHVYADNGSFTATLTVTDDDGGMSNAALIINVVNAAPVIGTLNIAPSMVDAVGNTVTLTADFTDAGVLDTHRALIDWGNGTVTTATVIENAGSGTLSGNYAYTTPGVYTITVTLTENEDGGSDVALHQFMVVYDPDGGFVTGGGWIQSPAGAYVDNPSSTGKATFGFVSKYKNGAQTPSGVTEFQYHTESFNFHSSNYEWLVVAGARAQYKGSGTVNGAGNFGFLLTAIDGQISGGGGSDKFRIKIWDKNDGDRVVYDNKLGASDDADPDTLLMGGQIKIHK